MKRVTSRYRAAPKSTFEENVVVRITNAGYMATCKKGFWRVDGKNRADVMKEAKQYFWQYYADGEYDKDLT